MLQFCFLLQHSKESEITKCCEPFFLQLNQVCFWFYASASFFLFSPNMIKPVRENDETQSCHFSGLILKPVLFSHPDIRSLLLCQLGQTFLHQSHTTFSVNSLSFSTSFLVFYVNIFNNRLINIRILFFLNIKKVTCCEKKYLPPSCFFLFVCFAYLLHISGHNLILILDRKKSK